MNVFYRAEQTCLAKLPSPSAGKPALVVERWRLLAGVFDLGDQAKNLEKMTRQIVQRL